MANNVGTLVVAPIRPASDQDTFPAFYANEGRGGFHAVATLAERDAIPEDRRQAGMRCWVETAQTTYRLTASNTWVDAAEGGAAEFNPWTAETDPGTSDVIAMTAGQVTSITSTVQGSPRVATTNRTNGRITSVVTTWGIWTHTETINYDGSGNVSSVALSITT